MAVRIRKLARELDRDPEELVAVLAALGFAKFRSADDMLVPAVEAKLRRGLAQGVRGVVTERPPAPTRPRDSVEDMADAGADLMAQLVPGAVRTGGRPSPPRTAPRPPQGRAPASQAASPSPSQAREVSADTTRPVTDVERAALESARRTLASERAVVEAQRLELDEERRLLAAQQRSLAGDRAALDELATALERERVQLGEERLALSGLKERSGGRAVSLEELLEARGLRGSDEHERALTALARGRHLRDVLWSLTVQAPEPFARVLDERLLLAAGDVPDAIARSAAVVAVAPDRADLPDAATLERWTTQLGEQLLLHGARRLLVIGGKSRWHRLLRDRLDARIEARWLPGGPRTVAMATEDVTWADVIVLWRVVPDEPARRIYQAGRPIVIEVASDALSAFFEHLRDALSA